MKNTNIKDVINLIKEYASLIPKALKNPKQVLEGIYNQVQMEYGHLPKDQQDEIIKRRLICGSCPFLSKNAKTSQEYLDLTGEHLKTDRLDDFVEFAIVQLPPRLLLYLANAAYLIGTQKIQTTNNH